MHPRRLARLNALIKQTVSTETMNLKDPDIGFVTIIESELASDLSHVKVYYSVLGSPEEKEKTAEALKRAAPAVKRGLAKLENLKKIPDVHFIFDEGVERADRIYRLLNNIQNEEKPTD